MLCYFVVLNCFWLFKVFSDVFVASFLAHQEGLHEFVQVSIQNGLGIGGLHSGTQVLDHLVGMKDVGADLASPFDSLFLALQFRLLCTFFLEFKFVEVALEDSEGVLAVVQLGAGFRVLHNYSGRDMPYPHSGLHLVHVLPAGTGGAEGVPFQVCRVNHDFNTLIYKWVNEYGREGGLAFSLGVVRRDSHQAVNSVFGLKIAVGIVSFDLQVADLMPASSPSRRSVTVTL